MPFDRRFGYLIFLIFSQIALMMVVMANETCWWWILCDKHILHTCICWFYYANWNCGCLSLSQALTSKSTKKYAFPFAYQIPSGCNCKALVQWTLIQSFSLKNGKNSGERNLNLRTRSMKYKILLKFIFWGSIFTLH